MKELPFHLQQDLDSCSTDELEAAGEIYDRLVAGTLYPPGTKFMPKPEEEEDGHH